MGVEVSGCLCGGQSGLAGGFADVFCVVYGMGLDDEPLRYLGGVQ